MPSLLSKTGVTAGRVVAHLAARAKWNHLQMQPSSCRTRLQQLDLVSLFRPVAQNQRGLFGALKRQLSKLAPLQVTSLSASISDSLPTTSMSTTTSSTTTSTTTVKGGMQFPVGLGSLPFHSGRCPGTTDDGFPTGALVAIIVVCAAP